MEKPDIHIGNSVEIIEVGIMIAEINDISQRPRNSNNRIMVKTIPIKMFRSVSNVSFAIKVVVSVAISRCIPCGRLFWNSANLLRI